MPPKREYIDTQIKHKVKAPNDALNDERTGDTSIRVPVKSGVFPGKLCFIKCLVELLRVQGILTTSEEENREKIDLKIVYLVKYGSTHFKTDPDLSIQKYKGNTNGGP